MSSAKVITSEGAGDEMLNNDEIMCNNDNMILLSDACLLTLRSCSNSHEECIESFTEFCDSLLMNDTRNESTSYEDSIDYTKQGERTSVGKNTVNEIGVVTPKLSTSTSSTSIDVSTSLLKSRPKRQRMLVETQSEKNDIALDSQLITDEAITLGVDKREDVDEVTEEWRNYCKEFADKVAKIRSSSIRYGIRFNMEQMLNDAGKKEGEKAKTKEKVARG